jgi:hypothetical protein
MLESTVDLLNDLFLIAMILLTVVCVVVSILAALCAVNRGIATSEGIQGDFLDDMGSQPGGLLETKAIVNKAAPSQLEVSSPEDLKFIVSPKTPTVGAMPIGTYRS